MKTLIFFLLSVLPLGAETLVANINRIDQPTNVTIANASDNDNAATVITAKLCWDDPTFTNNCTTQLVNAGGGHSLTWTPTTIGTVNPQDGLRHQLYLKALSPSAPNTSADRMFDGSPWPYIYLSGGVGPAWVANIETNPAPLSPSVMAVFANSSDTYSVGSSGATVCNVGGTILKDDGVAGYFIQKYSIPCANARVITTPVTQTITEALFNTNILPTLSALPSTLQAIAIGWNQPVQVVSTSGGQYYPNTIDYVMSTGGVLYTGTNGVACTAGGNSGTVGIWHDNISTYFNSNSKAPFTDLGIRPAMQLTGESCTTCASTTNNATYTSSVTNFKAMLDTSYAANLTDPTGGVAYWARTSDNARSIMAQIVAPQSLGTNLSAKISGTLLGSAASPTSKQISATNIMFYMNAADQYGVSGASFMPGSIASSYTSFGGYLAGGKAQTLGSFFLNQGASASHGEFVEPCDDGILKTPLLEIAAPKYASGETAVEVLWKSVAYPQNSVFMGDPLAHPYIAPVTGSNVTFTMSTTGLASLAYGAQSMYYSGHSDPVITQISFKDSMGVITTGSTSTTSVSVSGNVVTNNYSWGSLVTTFSASGNKLTASCRINNTTANTIVKLEILPVGIQFPATPISPPATPLDTNYDSPSSTYFNWGTGSADAVDENVTTPLINGFLANDSPIGVHWHIAMYTDYAVSFGNYPPVNRTIAPSSFDTWTQSVRFGSATDTESVLASDIFSLFAATYPQVISALPKKPIASLFMTTKKRPTNCATNPRGWFNDCTVDVTTSPGIAAFQTRLLTYADGAIAEMTRVGAQGGILWDLDGQDTNNTYKGDPTQYESLAPELVGVLDTFVNKFINAGFRIGFTIRPQIFTEVTGVVNISGTAVTWVSGTNFSSFFATGTTGIGNDFIVGGTHYSITSVNSSTSLTLNTSAGTFSGVGYTYAQHADDPNPQTNLSNKINYCITRWGSRASMFYVDSDLLSNGTVNPASYFQALHTSYPSASIFPEMKNTQHYAYTIPYQDGIYNTFQPPFPTSQVYPSSSMIVRIPDCINFNTTTQTCDLTVTQVIPQLTQAVNAGSVLLFDGWYRHTANDVIRGIYNLGSSYTGTFKHVIIK